MKRVSIEAFEDKARPEGGHAIVLLQGVQLQGLTETSAAPAYRIHLVDAAADGADLDQWPAGDHYPVRATAVARGVELVLGPDITQCPLLMPGTAVAIEVPALDSRGEFLWPDVSPLARPKRRGILGKRIVPEPRAEALPADLPRVAGSRDRHEPTASEAMVSPAHSGHAPSSADAPVSPATGLEQVTAAPAAVSPTAPGPGAVPSPAGPTRMTNRSLAPARVATAPAPAAVAEPPSEFVTWYPHARGGRMDSSPAAPTAGGPPTAAPFAPGSSLRLAAAVVVSVLAVEAALSMLGQTRPIFAGRRDSTATTSTSAAASGQLYEALSAGATSPRGTPGRGVAANRALESAAGALQGTGAARDTDEGAYWLKHYLAATLGEDRTVRALTQLGTTYAEPARGAPDFARARVVWELSSAFGDPVAMCFVGRLHEAGLGVAADRGQALLWYERSRASGGCPQLDEAIARVK